MSKSILIVDSDELVRDLLSIRLAHAGYTCSAVCDGEAALSRLARIPADLVIMDAMMPMLSGVEALVRIRADALLSHIPVLILSQKTGAAERQTMMACGAAGYMTKPFCCEELLAQVEALLAEGRSSLVRRLKITVLGSAALTAALPASAGAVGPAAAPLITATSTAAASPDANAPTASGDAQPTIPVPAPSLQSPGTEIEPFAEPDPEPWRTRHAVTLVQGRSWIAGRENPNWNDTNLAYSFRPDARSGYVFEVDRAQRFGLVDYQFSARGDWRIGRRTSVYAAAVVTPASEFRERRGLRAGISHTVAPQVEVGASTRVGEFADGPKLAVTPYVALSTKGESMTLVAEQINLWNLEGPADYRTGYGFRLRAQPSDRLRGLVGFARYPEVELGVARDVRSIYGGVSFDLSESVGVSASYANERYETLFTRNGVSLGLTYRWRGSG